MVNHTFLKLLGLLLIFGVGIFTYRGFEPKDGPIKLGASLPLSGITQELGTEMVAGASVWFEHINATGGIHGRPIEFIYYDDKYEPQNTAHNLQKLTEEDEVFALFGFVGTPTIRKVLPQITASNIPLIGSYTGAAFLRDKAFDNLVNFRPSYQEEIDALIEHLHVEEGLRRFAVFYQNDGYGEEGYIATVNALNRYGLRLAGEGTYKRNTLSIRHAFHEIQSSTPEAIIIVGAYKPSAHFIKHARENGMKDVYFCPISFVNADAIVNELAGDTRNMLFSQTVPSYEPSASEAAAQYRMLLKRYQPSPAKPTLVSYEAFLAAKALTFALKETGQPLNRDELLDTFNTNQTADLGGVGITFNHLRLHATVYLSRYYEGAFHIFHSRQFQ